MASWYGSNPFETEAGAFVFTAIVSVAEFTAGSEWSLTIA